MGENGAYAVMGQIQVALHVESGEVLQGTERLGMDVGEAVAADCRLIRGTTQRDHSKRSLRETIERDH